MNVYYYPVNEATGSKNRVQEIITKDLRKKCGLGWKALDAFMYKLKHKDISWLKNEIVCESKKHWEKRYLAKLESDVYESIAAKHQNNAQSEMYFLFLSNGILILLAESKTDEGNSI
jgi:hypothetical protein